MNLKKGKNKWGEDYDHTNYLVHFDAEKGELYIHINDGEKVVLGKPLESKGR